MYVRMDIGILQGDRGCSGRNRGRGVGAILIDGREEREDVETMWQSGLMRVTRNHVLSGAQVRILASSRRECFVG